MMMAVEDAEEGEEEEQAEQSEVEKSEVEEPAAVRMKPAAVRMKPAAVRMKPAAAEKKEMFYGWNSELQCAYRHPVLARGSSSNTSAGLEEMAIPLEKNPPADDVVDLDQYLARFEDGDAHVVSKTNADIRAIIASMSLSAKATNESLWTAEHPQTKHILELKLKIDKKLLLGIFEQKKFVCGLNISGFSETDMPIDATSGAPMKVDAEHAGLQKAKAFLTPIVQQYVDLKCTREEMISEKKRKYTEHLAEKKKDRQGAARASKAEAKKKVVKASSSSTSGKAIAAKNVVETDDDDDDEKEEEEAVCPATSHKSVATPTKAKPPKKTRITSDRSPPPLTTPEAQRLAPIPESIFDKFMQM